mmetsp:Transcript_14058/g.39763  ORF Transcript_14058/g.39763 Transcript_14058/m.39763 type:complete len:265 (-) Transcript_14058:91-885(-)
MVVSLDPQGGHAVPAQRMQQGGVADVNNLVRSSMHDKRGRLDLLHKLQVRIDVQPHRPLLYRGLEHSHAGSEGAVEDDPPELLNLGGELARGTGADALTVQNDVLGVHFSVVHQVAPARPDVCKGVPDRRRTRASTVSTVVVAKDVHAQSLGQVDVHRLHNPKIDCVAVRVKEGLLRPHSVPRVVRHVYRHDLLPSPSSPPSLRVQLHNLASAEVPRESTRKGILSAFGGRYRVCRWLGREVSEHSRHPVDQGCPQTHPSTTLP